MSHDVNAHSARNEAGRGYEKRDVYLWAVIMGSIVLVSLIIVSLIGMRLLFDYYLAREMRLSPAANPLAIAGALPPEPRLEAKPIEQLQRLRSEENLALNTYGWVDRERGIVRIPIERAMDLVAERGLP
jgi:hypothetical protein